MKNIIIVALLLLSTSLSFGQKDYNRWALGAEFGAHSVGDQSAVVTDQFNHYGLSARYSINPIVSLGVTGGFDNLTLQDLAGDVNETNYYRISSELFIDVFDILDLQNNVFTMLAHGGAGYSLIRSDKPNDYRRWFYDSYREDVVSLTGGVTGLFKLTRSLALSLDARITSNLSQDRTLDNYMDIANAEVNSTLTNFSVGITWYPSKKDNDKEHADWYVEPAVVPVVNNITQVTEVREITKTVVAPATNCECVVQEFVFFDHDKSVIREEALNAITKVYTYLSENEDSKLKIYGFASPTQSSAEYNLKLSERRGEAVTTKLEEMGISRTRIEIIPEGKDYKYTKEMMHDIARRVELIIE